VSDENATIVTESSTLPLPLITVVILSYQNTTQLPNAIQSVLCQTYARIELIISDDASDFFAERDIIDLIEDKKGENLESYLILRNSSNVGTVRNLKKAMQHVHGDFYMTIGADDQLYDNWVLSCFASAFQENGPDIWWACGLTSMMIPDMTQQVKVYPEDMDIPVLKRRNAEELFSLWARKFIVATPGMCFRTGIADLVGGYSDDYVYMEDWPLILKLLRKGITPFYIHKYVVKHSMGGVSNHNTLNGLSIRKKFLEEKYHMFKTEVEPYFDHLSPYDQKQYRIYMNRWMDRIYIMEYVYGPSSYREKLSMMLKDFRILKWVAEIKITRLKNNFIKYTQDWKQILSFSFLALIAHLLIKAACPILSNNLFYMMLSSMAIITACMGFVAVFLRLFGIAASKTIGLFRKYLKKGDKP
jgi:glycosyltransferase involved in cell wall biosynthesis